jgi:uncharacterized protein YdaU (DUF1376 family)
VGQYEESGRDTALTASAPNQPQPAKEVDALASSKSTRSPAFQFYPKDFLSSSKVGRMSLTEVGTYILLLSHAWLDGGLPTDTRELAKIVHMNPQRFARMWSGALSECFVERSGRLVNDRLEIEHRKQLEFRRRQSDHGKKGGRPKKESHEKGLGFSGLSQAEAGKSSPISSLQSSSVRTHTPGAPIHASHKKHAACGRVCVPADLHSRFVRARNHNDADSELRKWYQRVDDEWSVGAKKDANTGGDDYRFWRARFDEQWPDASAAKRPSHADSRLPTWARESA